MSCCRSRNRQIFLDRNVRDLVIAFWQDSCPAEGRGHGCQHWPIYGSRCWVHQQIFWMRMPVQQQFASSLVFGEFERTKFDWWDPRNWVVYLDIGMCLYIGRERITAGQMEALHLHLKECMKPAQPNFNLEIMAVLWVLRHDTLPAPAWQSYLSTTEVRVLPVPLQNDRYLTSRRTLIFFSWHLWESANSGVENNTRMVHLVCWNLPQDWMQFFSSVDVVARLFIAHQWKGHDTYQECENECRTLFAVW